MVSKERRFTKPVGYSKRVREQNLVSIPRAVLDPKVKVSKVASVVRGKSQLDVFGKLFHFLAERRQEFVRHPRVSEASQYDPPEI
jgi:hypothetical protein